MYYFPGYHRSNHLGEGFGIDDLSKIENLVLPRVAGFSMGHACPAMRESEMIGSAIDQINLFMVSGVRFQVSGVSKNES